MKRVNFKYLIIAWFFAYSAATIAVASLPELNPPACLPALPKEVVNDRFATAHTGFSERWSKFKTGKTFASWHPSRSNEAIIKEFSTISQWRNNAWLQQSNLMTTIANKDYMCAQDLLPGHRYRWANCIAFDYNLADSSYNASFINIEGLCFLAMEGPSENLTNDFFRLLHSYQVGALVRLTKDWEGDVLKCHNYWSEIVSTAITDLISELHIPQERHTPYRVPYLGIDEWDDHKGIPPKQLLSWIEAVNATQTGPIVAVHCSAGVGRTGTFIAACALKADIDRQLKEGISPSNVSISIQEIVAKLSLQRPFMVAKPEQYLALYSMVSHYIQ